MPDTERFQAAKQAVERSSAGRWGSKAAKGDTDEPVQGANDTAQCPNNTTQRIIGTLGEKTLHAVLKHYIEPDSSCHERPLGRYVADIVNEHGITEIQTGSFSPLRGKLAAFLECGMVTVVHPIPMKKWLCWIDCQTGAITDRRKSPKTGAAMDILPELYKIKSLLLHPNLRLQIVLLELTEHRTLSGWSADKKRGSRRAERYPEAILGEVALHCPYDYRALLPEGLPDPFSSRQFAKAAHRNLAFAQTAVHLLHHVGILDRVGKQGNSFLYKIKSITKSI